ncbi:MAG: protein translocase subunit SecD [Muribaculaceae bacterium]|nr:protein translocase subunit SecD [Muribaculaceae bacterium]
MQSKGTLGSIVAGVIAIFLVLVCLFYLSFTFVTNKCEEDAVEYATKAAGDAGVDSEPYKQAYKNYIDSIGKEPVYMGYTFNEVQKWGVGLGLDLKGGMNVILQVSMPDIVRSMSTVENDTIFDSALNAAEAMVKKHESDDFVKSFCEVYRQKVPTADFSVVFKDIVDKNTADADVVAKLKQEVKDRVNNSATNVLRSRIDQFGVVSPNIQVLQGKDGQILLELPGVKEHERVRQLLQRSANLEFYETYRLEEIAGALSQLDNKLVADTTDAFNGFWAYFIQGGAQGTPNIGLATAPNKNRIDEILNSAAAKQILPSNLKLAWEVKPQTAQFTDTVSNKQKNIDLYSLIALKTANGGKAALDGSCVIAASADYDNLQGNVVSMKMDSDGAKQWARVTGNNVGRSIAIVLDGMVYSYPNVNNAIEGGSSQITGRFTIEEAQDLANILKSGKMTARVEIISDMVIGPSLGQEAIEAGFTSFIVALVLLMVFMMMYYGVIPGLVANFALICNLFFTFGILASFQAVLTLSGIAGIVLALGMAVDANVLIFERTKEELRAGKNVRTAIADGYSNAFSAIFDSNLTSVITGLILLFYGTGPIKGFATTLIIGLVCSFFTAVYLSRLIFIWGAKAKPFEKLTFTTGLSRNLLTNTKINFLAQRKYSFIAVAVVVAVVAGSFVMRGLNQGIDFSGGRNYIVKLDKDVKPSEIEAKLVAKFPNSTVNVINIEGADQVRVSTNYRINEEGAEIEQEIVDILYTEMKPYLREGMTETEFSTTDETQGIMSSQKVGPTVADDMRNAAIVAVILSLIAMFLYILVRFRNVAFSVGALAAVAFTAFTIIGFYSLFWGVLPFAMEIDQTFIAAILTVIGYQINDTVVVFDRVRENITLYPKHDFGVNVNNSLNSTLSRTLMTSFTTLLVLLVIFILGGESIRSFTFAMLFGVIIGTLATIYVATPVAYLIATRKNKKA